MDYGYREIGRIARVEEDEGHKESRPTQKERAANRRDEEAGVEDVMRVDQYSKGKYPSVGRGRLKDLGRNMTTSSPARCFACGSDTHLMAHCQEKRWQRCGRRGMGYVNAMVEQSLTT